MIQDPVPWIDPWDDGRSIDGWFFRVNVGKYISPTDPMEVILNKKNWNLALSFKKTYPDSSKDMFLYFWWWQVGFWGSPKLSYCGDCYRVWGAPQFRIYRYIYILYTHILYIHISTLTRPTTAPQLWGLSRWTDRHGTRCDPWMWWRPFWDDLRRTDQVPPKKEHIWGKDRIGQPRG